MVRHHVRAYLYGRHFRARLADSPVLDELSVYERIVHCVFCWYKSGLALLRARKKIIKMIPTVTVLFVFFWTPVVMLFHFVLWN